MRRISSEHMEIQILRELSKRTGRQKAKRRCGYWWHCVDGRDSGKEQDSPSRKESGALRGQGLERRHAPSETIESACTSLGIGRHPSSSSWQTPRSLYQLQLLWVTRSVDRFQLICYKRNIFWAGRKALVHPRAGTFSPPFSF